MEINISLVFPKLSEVKLIIQKLLLIAIVTMDKNKYQSLLIRKKLLRKLQFRTSKSKVRA